MYWQLFHDINDISTNYLSPLPDESGGLDGNPDIWVENLLFAAVCCCTLTSAASAKCIKVFLSGLSSKFLQPIHLHIFEHIILAWKKWNKNAGLLFLFLKSWTQLSQICISNHNHWLLEYSHKKREKRMNFDYCT